MKRSMLIWIACAAVCCTGRLAFGALDTSAATTLTLNRNNTGGYLSSLTNAAHWTANAGGTATAPQLMDADISANPDAAGYDYYVGNGYNLRTFKIDEATSPYAGKLITFGGRSLHVGPGVFWPACSFEKFPLRVADLHFREDSKIYLSTHCGLTNSTITVESSASKPFRIYNSGNSSANLKFSFHDCTLIGNASADILVGGSGVTGNSTVFYSGDSSGYFGTIRCETVGKTSTLELDKGTDLSHATITLKATSGNAAATLTMNSGANISVGTLNLYNCGKTSSDSATSTFGTVNVYAGGSVLNKTSGRMNIGTLNQSGGEVTINSSNRINPQTHNLTGGRVVIGQKATATISTLNPTDAEVSFRYNYNTDEHRYGCVNVTNSFVGPVTLVVDSSGMGEFYQGLSSAQTVVKIDKTAVSAAPSAADFPVVVPDSYGFVQEQGLARIEEDADAWNVVLVPPQFIHLTRDLKNGVPWTSSSTNVWSDGLPPHNDADYVSRYQFYTYGNVSTAECRFDMKSLTISATELWLSNRDAIFPKLTLEAASLEANNGSLTASGSSNNVYASEIHVRAGTLGNMRPYGGATFNVYAPITGGGVFQALNRGTAKPSGVNTNFGGSELNLMQASPDFTGKIRTWKYANGSYPYTVDESTKLGIALPLALGGPLDAFRYDALELSYFGCLKPLASMTLDTANRGIFVNWFGRMLVESNIVFHVNARLTMGGTLEKLGTGTLWLGASAAPKFTGAQLADPPSAAGADGTNLVRVLEGALGATTTNAVDGLALSFAEGGKLAVDAAATGDVAAYGLYNKKGNVTFDGANLAVAISPPEEVACATVGVLTVPTAQTAAFLDGTTPRLTADVPTNYRANFSYEEDASTGLTTFKVTVARRGMTIIFR